MTFSPELPKGWKNTFSLTLDEKSRSVNNASAGGVPLAAAKRANKAATAKMANAAPANPTTPTTIPAICPPVRPPDPVPHPEDELKQVPALCGAARMVLDPGKRLL